MAMFSENDLEAARHAGVLSEETYLKVKDFLVARSATAARSPLAVDDTKEKRRFDVTHVLWYAGALIVMTAMGMFSTTAFSLIGGVALTATGLIYALAFLLLGNFLWRKGLPTPGGLCVAVAISMVPLAIYGVEDALKLWGPAQGNPNKYRDFYIYIRGSWIYMEIGTLIAALIAFRFWPFAFIVFVASIALWFMSMDLAMWYLGERWGEFATRREVSLVFGCVMILIAWIVDLRLWRGGDFAYWLHLFGVMCFWAGLSLHRSDSSIDKAIYCLINIGLIFLGVFLGRRVYAVFGTIGIMLYLGDLCWHVFDNVIWFSFALSFIGVAVIGLGLFLHRNEPRLEAWLARNLPPGIGALRPVHARIAA
jgi:hypothetical protein